MGFQFYIKVDGQLTLIIDIFIKKHDFNLVILNSFRSGWYLKGIFMHRIVYVL